MKLLFPLLKYNPSKARWISLIIVVWLLPLVLSSNMYLLTYYKLIALFFIIFIIQIVYPTIISWVLVFICYLFYTLVSFFALIESFVGNISRDTLTPMFLLIFTLIILFNLSFVYFLYKYRPKFFTIV